MVKKQYETEDLFIQKFFEFKKIKNTMSGLSYAIEGDYLKYKAAESKKIIAIHKEIKELIRETFSKSELAEFNQLLANANGLDLQKENEKELLKTLALTEITTREQFELLNGFVGVSVSNESMMEEIGIANVLLANFESKRNAALGKSPQI